MYYNFYNNYNSYNFDIRMYYSKQDYKLVGYQKSVTKNKMYDAILQNKQTKKYHRVPFGDSRYDNYQDNTGLNLYPKLIHSDPKRRSNYKSRHKKDIREGFFSPGYFAMTVLWWGNIHYLPLP